MPIRRKSSIDKLYYESIGQGMLFGHDNIYFKTINLSKKPVSYTHLTLPTNREV